MDAQSRTHTRTSRLLKAAALPLVAALLPALGARAQTPPPPPTLPACTVAPSPATDHWPVANTDSIGTTAGTPITFLGSSLLANDTGTGPLALTGPIVSTPHHGGTVSGSDPYVYTPPAGYNGPDSFTYEMSDGLGHKSIGVVKVNVVGDTAAPSVAITAPAAGTVSGTVTIAASASDNIGVTLVRLFVDGTALPDATAAPYQASWNTSLGADGPHTLTAKAFDAAGNVGTSAAVVVNVANVVIIPTVDKMITSDGLNKRTTAAFSTATAGEVLVAFAASDGPAAANAQSLTIAGAGLTWTRVQRAATRFGDAEIWTATAAAPLTNVTVSSTQSATGFRQSLTVIAFTGVSGVGASSAAGAASGAPAVSLVAQTNGSKVYAVGNDWDAAQARTYPAGQVKVREVLDTTAGDTFWVQALAATTTAGASSAATVSGPTADQWNFAAVELRAGGTVPPPPPPPPTTVKVPNIVGVTDPAARTAIVNAGLTVGAVTSENNAAPAGQVIRQTPAANSDVTPGSSVAFVVSLGPVVTTGAPVIDAQAFRDGAGTVTTAPFSTTVAGDVLVALVGTDEPGSGANTQTITVSGAGLTWTRVARNAQVRGVAEIWTATASSVLSGVTVTSTQSIPSVNGAALNQSLTVLAFASASGVGGSSIASAGSGAPTVTLTAQAAGSAVYAVGIDFDRAVARTLPAGQVKVHEYLAPSGDTMWSQALVGTTTAIGQSVTLNALTPTADQWNFAIVEIKR